MKKIFQNLTCGLLVMCLLMQLSVTAFAQDNADEFGLTTPTELFIEVCDALFADNSKS